MGEVSPFIIILEMNEIDHETCLWLTGFMVMRIGSGQQRPCRFIFLVMLLPSVTQYFFMLQLLEVREGDSLWAAASTIS